MGIQIYHCVHKSWRLAVAALKEWLGGKGVPRVIVQEIKIRPYKQILKQTKICPRKWDSGNSLRFWYANRPSNPGQKARPHVNKKKKKRICHPQSNNERKWKDLAREMKRSCQRDEKLWNMKVTMILIVVGALETVSKGLEKILKELEIRRRIDTIQTTTFFRSARIIRKTLEIWEDLLSLKLWWKNVSGDPLGLKFVRIKRTGMKKRMVEIVLSNSRRVQQLKQFLIC